MWDVLILGGGPAGLAAGLYAARAGMKTALLEAELIGGQASTTNLVENYPGFPGGIGGPELMMAFEEQARGAGLTVLYESAKALRLNAPVKSVTSDRGVHKARSVVLAMGAKRRKLGVPGEDELTGRGISYCATCDGAFYRGKPVAVVGGGNTAVEDAVYLSGQSSVTLIHRRDSLRASAAEARRALKNPNIRFLWNSVVEEAEAAEGGVRLLVRNLITKMAEPLNAAACFVAIGTVPETRLLAEGPLLSPEGYVDAGEDTRTSLEGVFCAGDIRKKPLRQIATAVSDGATAGTAAAEYAARFR